MHMESGWIVISGYFFRIGDSEQPSTLGGGGGRVDLNASVEEADHQCWLVVVSNIVFFRVFSVEYSNMYNLSINELCTYYGEICIFAPIIA